MKKIKLLFQGDSITDAGRDRDNIHNLGTGYVGIAAHLIREKYPNVEFEFIDLGISGNRTGQLFDRLHQDCIVHSPDIISILIGVNDVWHRYSLEQVHTTDEQVEVNYRSILEQIKLKCPEAKLLMMQPFTEGDDQAHMRADLEKVQIIVDTLAEKYADSYIKLDEIIHSHEKYGEEHYFTRDGVHPNSNGAMFIASLYADAVSPLIDEIIAK